MNINEEKLDRIIAEELIKEGKFGDFMKGAWDTTKNFAKNAWQGTKDSYNMLNGNPTSSQVQQRVNLNRDLYNYLQQQQQSQAQRAINVPRARGGSKIAKNPTNQQAINAYNSSEIKNFIFQVENIKNFIQKMGQTGVFNQGDYTLNKRTLGDFKRIIDDLNEIYRYKYNMENPKNQMAKPQATVQQKPQTKSGTATKKTAKVNASGNGKKNNKQQQVANNTFTVSTPTQSAVSNSNSYGGTFNMRNRANN